MRTVRISVTSKAALACPHPFKAKHVTGGVTAAPVNLHPLACPVSLHGNGIGIDAHQLTGHMRPSCVSIMTSVPG